MSAKHTPGPWGIRYKTNGYPDLITALNESWSEPGNITNIIRKASFCSPSMPESIANAHLISAAPDLLEALENLENDDGSIPEHAWNLCQAAINKAKGIKP